MHIVVEDRLHRKRGLSTEGICSQYSRSACNQKWDEKSQKSELIKETINVSWQ